MNSKLVLPSHIGLHQFTAYEGEIERSPEGLILNPVVFKSPVVKNLIVTNGKNLAMDRLFGLASEAALSHIGVGVNATAASASDTRLDNAVTGNVLLKAFDSTATRASQTVTCLSTFGTSEANFQWNEAGLFNGATNGTSKLFNRVIIGPFTKTSAVSIIYTVTVTQS